MVFDTAIAVQPRNARATHSVDGSESATNERLSVWLQHEVKDTGAGLLDTWVKRQVHIACRQRG